MTDVEQFLAVQNILGEGPLWSVRDQALYWVDIDGQAFFKLDYATKQYDRFEVGQQIGALAENEDGRLLLALRDGFATWQNGSVTMLTDNNAYKPPTRFNDGAVDSRGRFWAGTMGDSAEYFLYRLDHDGSTTIMESGIKTSNGIGWSPDDTVMYYSDSGIATVYAYDFNAQTGGISNRRVFITGNGDGKPDGLTVDSEGCIWTAYWDGWKVRRFDPEGNMLLEIPMPVQRPTSCMFGGPNLDELFVTSASIGTDRQEQPMAGDLFRIKPGVKGKAENLAKLRV